MSSSRSDINLLTQIYMLESAFEVLDKCCSQHLPWMIQCSLNKHLHAYRSHHLLHASHLRGPAVGRGHDTDAQSISLELFDEVYFENHCGYPLAFCLCVKTIDRSKERIDTKGFEEGVTSQVGS